MNFRQSRELAGKVDKVDFAIVGTGFASTFFLHRLLQQAGPSVRIAVLERGSFLDQAERIARRDLLHDAARRYYQPSGMAKKTWNFSVGFGGSSNCWVGNTPRMLPQDFRMQTLFGVGRDWPFSYDDLEPYYFQVEELMQISGSRNPHYPASGPLPLPPHRPNLPEVLLSRAWPGLFGPMPTARASRATATRSPCCANGVCSICPANAKFTILNDMKHVYQDPRVTCYLGAEVRGILTEGGRAVGVSWRDHNALEGELRANQIVLGANALFNAAILRQSDDPSPLTGKRLHEQVAITGSVHLDNVESFQGSTSVTGLGLQLYADDARRKTMAAALIETKSVGTMRTEPGRWRQLLPFRVVFETIPSEKNEVRHDSGQGKLPTAHYEEYGDYTERAIAQLPSDLTKVFAALPVEKLEFDDLAPTESHIQGTTIMGTDQASSVTDQDGLHHRWRDLRVLGSSLFPTGAPANPTLTLAAHALRSADRMGRVA